MTQINRDELIEKAIENIKEIEIYDDGYGVVYAQDGYYQQVVEAVLKSMGDYLPSIQEEHNKNYGHMAFKVESGHTAYGLYSEFKNICEGK